jgi:hypothetical protein
MVECLPSLYETLGLIPNTGRKEKKEGRKEGRKERGREE